MRGRRGLALSALLAGAAAAQEPTLPDPAHFRADEPAVTAPHALGLRLAFGGEAFDRRRALPDAPERALRASLDWRREWRPGAEWTVGVSERAEWAADRFGHDVMRHALREAYVGVRHAEAWFFDAGRINLRGGVASGFNPTDWLREGATLPQASQSPASLRENRLGSVMLRAQHLAEWGALQAAVMPRLARPRAAPSSGGLDWGSTNGEQAFHARLAPRLGDAFSLEAVTYGRAGRAPQWGFNVSAAASEALLLHAELAGGKRRGLAAPATAEAPVRWHTRVATGFAWTHAGGTVLTVERHYVGDALRAADWDAWREAADAPTQRRLAQLRAQRGAAQEPLTRDAWFLRVAHNGLGARGDLDLSAFMRLNPHDGSFLWQADAAWHRLAGASLYATVGGFAGGARSEYGANPTRTSFALRLEAVF